MFAMVLQDTWLFEGTVRENLVYNMQGVTDADLERVCRACGLDKFVRSLPHGFDTVLTDSTSISAGQKQMLTIARAMLQNSPMLILDEATSSVDTRTELIIQRAMDRADAGPNELRHRAQALHDNATPTSSLSCATATSSRAETHEELMERRRLLRGAVQQPVRKDRIR